MARIFILLLLGAFVLVMWMIELLEWIETFKSVGREWPRMRASANSRWMKFENKVLHSLK
jgi:hypothetical protein